MKNYEAKTRNWHCRSWVRKLLDLTKKIGVQKDGEWEDNDGKYWFESNNLPLCFIVWCYFKALSHWGGGWTYIRNNYKKNAMNDYKNFYL
jgi:hypothetical protein